MFYKTKLEQIKEDLISISKLWIILGSSIFLSFINLQLTIPRATNKYEPISIFYDTLIFMLSLHRTIITYPNFPFIILLLILILSLFTLWILKDYYQTKKEETH